MRTFYLHFVDFPSNHKGEKGLNHGPIAYVGLKTSSVVKFPGKKGGEVELTVISPQCCSYREFTEYLTMLRQDLKTIEKEAEKYFRKSNMLIDIS